jgi:DNA-binding FadR family transcriptional regulator
MPHRRFLQRIRAEFMEMPGLQLNLVQAQRLYGMERTVCKAALDALVDEHFLRVKDGKYRRVSPEHSGHSHPETAKHADEHDAAADDDTLRARRPRRGVAR